MWRSRRRMLALLSSGIVVTTAGCASYDLRADGSPPPEIDLAVEVSAPDGNETFFEQRDIEDVGATGGDDGDESDLQYPDEAPFA